MRAVHALRRGVRCEPGAHNICSRERLLPLCNVCDGGVMLLVCMGKPRFGGTTLYWAKGVANCRIRTPNCSEVPDPPPVRAKKSKRTCCG